MLYHAWSGNSTQTIPLGLFVLAIIGLIVHQRRRRQSIAAAVSEERITRVPGEWPVDVAFRYPDIPAHPAESLAEIEPIPYRPFKRDYHVNMGIRSMPFEAWIELDKEFSNYHNIKLHRIKARGNDLIQVMDDVSARAAAVELVHGIAEYLHRRYPSTFAVLRETKDAAIKQISILPLAKAYNLPAPLIVRGNVVQAVSREDAEAAMQICALLVQEDIALMLEGPDGKYYLRAGT